LNPLTVGVPVYNSDMRLSLFLPCLLNQTFPARKTDIIFVDNGSTDSTLSALDSFKSKYGCRYHSLTITRIKRQFNQEPNVEKITNIVAARNRIVELSPKENNVLFIDDDMNFEPNAINQLIEFSEKNKADIAAALMPMYIQVQKDGEKRNEIFLAAFVLIGNNLHPLGNFISDGISEFKVGLWKDRGYRSIDVVGMAFTLINRSVLDKVKFRIDRGEDVDFCLDARKLGFSVMLNNNLWVDHVSFRYKKTVKHGVLTLEYLGKNI
jgi:glycosyltransferase involved in cell wall biosynthesis